MDWNNGEFWERTTEGLEEFSLEVNGFEEVSASEDSFAMRIDLSRAMNFNVDGRNSNNRLATLTINNGTLTPAFNADVMNYTASVGYDVTRVVIGATLAEERANFVTNYGPRTVNLNVGRNEIPVRVQAENGGVRTYTITITREEEKAPSELPFVGAGSAVTIAVLGTVLVGGIAIVKYNQYKKYR